MNGFKKTRFLLGAAATGLALVAGFLLWAQVSAATPSVTVESGTAAPGEEVTVAVSANVPDGLGAWTLDIAYDTDVVTPTACDGDPANSVCNTHYAADSVRVTGASANGIRGEKVLGHITFKCGSSAGNSALTITLNVLADATVGNPRPIDAGATINSGRITCAVAVPATTAPTALPIVGAFDGGSGGSSDMGWILAALSMAGLAAVAGLGALRMRARR